MKNHPLKDKFLSLALRILLLTVVLVLFAVRPEALHYPQPFLEQLRPLHLVWLLWMFLFIPRLFPSRQTMMAGKKIFARYNDIETSYSRKLLREYIKKRNIGTLRTVATGMLVLMPFYVIYYIRLIGPSVLIALSVVLFVMDLIFEIFYCPFQRHFMQNRCCHVCRIYSWNSLLVVMPLFIIPGFFSWSLIAVGFIGFLESEISWLLHPEYFWHISNKALRCENCTKKMCAIRKPLQE